MQHQAAIPLQTLFATFQWQKIQQDQPVFLYRRRLSEGAGVLQYRGVRAKLPKTKDIIWIDVASLEKNMEILSLRLSDSLPGIKDNDGNLRELHVDFETFIKEPINYDPS